MNKPVLAFSLALLALAPCAALSQAAAPAMAGVGPSGYDFMLGNWTCTNSQPSKMSGPATSTIAVTKTAGGALAIHSSGTGYDAMGYVVYVPATKTWLNPSAYADGSTSNESTTGTGAKSTWTGSYVDAAGGKKTAIRDKYVFSSTQFTDVSQAKIGGAWKTQGTITCTKS